MKKCKLSKPCEKCGEMFGRKIMTSGTGAGYYESKKQWLSRPYCGVSCSNSANALKTTERMNRLRYFRASLEEIHAICHAKFCLASNPNYSSINYIYGFDVVVKVDFRKREVA